MIPTNAGLVAGKAYLVAIQLYQNTGQFRTVKIRTFKTVVTENDVRNKCDVKMDCNGKTLKQKR